MSAIPEEDFSFVIDPEFVELWNSTPAAAEDEDVDDDLDDLDDRHEHYDEPGDRDDDEDEDEGE